MLVVATGHVFMSDKPKRDRGVYRAAANPANPNHEWAKPLVEAFRSGRALDALKWLFKYRGYPDIMSDVVYADNPLLQLVQK